MSDDLELELTDVSREDQGPRTPLVLMGQEALAAIDAHARDDLDRELGGVLLGTAACSAEGTIVVVEAAIPALHTDASRGSVTFTHDTWEEINRIKDRDHPDKRIVGWYHTHPGFGLFLSEYDVFIHRNFFNLPWQVALVVDPRKGESGFFVWEGGELAGPREFGVAGPRAAPPPVAVPAPAAPAAPPAPVAASRESTTWRILMAMGLVAVLLLQVFALVRSPVAVGPDEVTAAELAGLREAVERLEARAPAPVTAAPEHARTYTVKRGDSLWRIAREHYGRGAMWGAIAVANDIEPHDIEPGMVLIIPLPAAREADKSGEPGTD